MGKLFLVFWLFIFISFSAFAQKKENTVVRVGFYEDNDSFQQGGTDEARKSGYAYEYYQKIAYYTGWTYEYNYGNREELYSKLVNDEIDIMAGVPKTSETQSLFLYPEYSMETEDYYIFVSEKYDKITRADYYSLNGKSIGVVRNSFMQEKLADFIKKHKLNTKIVLMPNFTACTIALSKGTIDGYVTSDNFSMSGVKPVIKIGDAEIYFAISKERKDLLEAVNDALDKIYEVSPSYNLLLKEKYFSRSISRTVLSEQEREWLSEKKVLKIGYIRNIMPFSGQTEEGEVTGIVKNLISNFEKYLNIEIQTMAFDNSELMEFGLRYKLIDAAFPVYSDIWIAEKNGFVQTDSIIKDRVMLIYKGAYREDLMDSIAIGQYSIGQKYYIQSYYPDAKLVYCKDDRDIYRAISEGDANCVIGCESILQRFLHLNPEYQKLNVAFLTNTEDFDIAVLKEQFILAEILNKAIRQIYDGEILNAMIENSYVTQNISMKLIVQKYSLFIFIFFFIFFIILVFVFTMYKYNSTKNRMELIKAKDALEVALKSANTSNSAKSAFLANMSHDIRTPMNAIIGMTTIAASHIDDKERVLNCLEKIAVSSKHLLGLINEILDMSKIEAGKVDMHIEPFNLSDLIDNLFTIARPLVDSKHHTMTLSVHDIEHELVSGDCQRLQQIFMNLLSNAVKYTPDGGKIDISISEKPSGRGRIGCYEFVIQDNGIGMTEEFRRNLFQSFSRATDDTRVSKVQGTGLGMAITKNLVQMMNGSISVESEYNKGSKFTVTIYLELLEDAKNIDISDCRGLSVLFVGENEFDCVANCQILEDMEIHTDFCQNTDDIIEVLNEKKESDEEVSGGGLEDLEIMDGADFGSTDKQKNGYFAVIIEWVKEFDVLSFIWRIRKEYGNDIKIIVASSLDWGEIELQARNSGANDFISLPLFKTRVAQLFSRLSGKQTEDAHIPPARLDATSFIGKKALLVEDNEINAEIATEILKNTGLEIDRVDNGKAAVDKMASVADEYYDIIFMDIQMPIMNGYEATVAIRAMERDYTKRIPIIAMTANAFAEDVEAARNAGMNEHVAKPLDLKKLNQVLIKWLEV